MSSRVGASSSMDDLTTIKGIGVSRQIWLQERFHVNTFADLAALSADTLEAQLKAEGKPISRQTIESWILQAGQLAQESEDEPAKREPAVRTEWHPFATFVMEFQQRIIEPETEEVQITTHYLEKDRTNNLETSISKEWPQFEQAAIFNWMLAQVKKEAPERASLIEAAQPTSKISYPQQEPALAEYRQVELPQAQSVPVPSQKQAVFSDKLEAMLARVRQIKAAQEKTRTAIAGTHNTEIRVADAGATAKSPAEAEPQYPEFSEQLRKVLVKVQSLESQHSQPFH